ncbi:MAG: hypothetical protein F6K20_14750, partial [Moorea sp. SIO2C4]|nr:hypothetical protein [Moorena sp. SIO2C4]
VLGRLERATIRYRPDSISISEDLIGFQERSPSFCSRNSQYFLAIVDIYDPKTC